MNKRIDLTNLGGFPFTQDTLGWMQDSYRTAFAAVAALCGSKSILYGVEVNGANVTDGWIAVDGEIMPFIGGVLGSDVIITEIPNVTGETFEDANIRDVYFTKQATSGVGGAFPFTDLFPLLSLQNVWRPGDIKERYCDAAYIAANFDVDGYGLNAEKGWRILSKAYPDTAGKVMVNLDPADTDFDTVGKTGGEKKHQLTVTEMPSHNHTISRGDAYTGNQYASGGIVGGGQPQSPQTSPNTGSTGGGQAHNNLQPYYVILKLVKL